MKIYEVKFAFYTLHSATEVERGEKFHEIILCQKINGDLFSWQWGVLKCVHQYGANSFEFLEHISRRANIGALKHVSGYVVQSPKVYIVIKWTIEYTTKQTACYQSNPSARAPYIGNFVSTT